MAHISDYTTITSDFLLVSWMHIVLGGISEMEPATVLTISLAWKRCAFEVARKFRSSNHVGPLTRSLH
jgi:hypothetical protein